MWRHCRRRGRQHLHTHESGDYSEGSETEPRRKRFGHAAETDDEDGGDD